MKLHMIVACAIAEAVIDTIHDEHLMQNTEEVSQYLISNLEGNFISSDLYM